MLNALVIFISAFLIFLIQPLIAKQILPWFGGSAAVWTTCLLFFQTALLAGYAYADAITRWLSLKRQVIVHSTLLVLSVLTLPIIADTGWKPAGDEEPIARILGLLVATIGLPYFLLATTTPLVGAWYWQRFRESAPYRLFALSNFASLLALLGFPFLIEPLTGNREIALIWSALFGLFAVLCISLGVITVRRCAVQTFSSFTNQDSASEEIRETPSVRAGEIALWVCLSALGSAVLLGVSSHLTQNISSAPLLWVIPLSLYLVTFIVSFDHPRWYVRAVYLPLAGVALVAMAWLSGSLDLAMVTPVYAAGLFVLCMVCHGELALRKPHPRSLTLFYLCISVGGALGSLVMAVLAPRVFDGYYEMYAMLMACSAMGLWLSIGKSVRVQLAIRAVGLVVLAAVGWLSWNQIRDYNTNVRFMERDFYGVVRTRDSGYEADFRSMIHGAISHGGQLLDENLQMTASSYFGPSSGYGRLFASLPDQPRTVGVIGLGAGALAVYARPNDHWVFYEISPAMVRAAKTEFTFLDKMKAPYEIVIGDGRLALEREAPRRYDVLAIDAFSGDSIPTHLITREAMDLYMKHLKPDGAIVLQATNRFVDLMPLARNLADAHGLTALLISDSPAEEHGPRYWLASTDQVIMTRNPRIINARAIAQAASPIAKRPDLPLFTDDYINLLKILKK